ncbi:hypothetical protein LCGC14_2399170, partial [marine sediment metagenome]
MRKKNRQDGVYTLVDDEGEQVTPMSDGWYLVHHTEIPNEPWWAVRHQCNDEQIYGMAFRDGNATCTGCKLSCPPEIG